MKMRFPPAMTVFVLLTVASSSVLYQGCADSGRRPNVLLITLDTTRADRLGCYGYPGGLTPNIDRIAEEGVLFEQAWTTVPLTLPAHSSIMTGLYPPEHGLRVNGANALPEQVVTLAELMSDGRYRTGAFIAAFVLDRRFGLSQGFSVYDDDMSGAADTLQPLHEYRNGRLVVDSALNWLATLDDDRFFAWVHLYDPHAPYHGHPDRFGDTYTGREYEAEIAFADLQVGRLLDFLQKQGLAENTLVAVVGDHGEGLGDHNESTHGFMVYGSTMRVPMILSLPHALPRGKRVTRPVSIVNVARTLAEVAGLKSAGSLGGGASLVPTWTGGEMENPVYYSESHAPFVEHRWCPLHAISTEAWKYIKTERPELYRLSDDPDELNDLSAVMPEQVREMESLLLLVEKQMTTSTSVVAHLSGKDQRLLESLGYAAGVGQPDAGSGERLPDIKDRIWLVNQNVQARRLRDEDPDGAIELLRNTVVEEPADYHFQRELAEALYQLSRYEAAIAEYDRLIEITTGEGEDRDKRRSGSHNRRGLAFFNLGRPQEAIKAYRRAIGLDETSPDPRSNLSILYATTGDFDSALEVILGALELDPKSADLHKNVALMYEKKNDPVNAAKHWEKVLQIEPLHSEAFQRLQKLQTWVRGDV